MSLRKLFSLFLLFGARTAVTFLGCNSSSFGTSPAAGNAETGSPSQDTDSITVSSTGAITIADATSNTLATGTLVAVADSPYLYDGTANKLSDPCNGLFTVRTSTVNSQQDLFVSFQGNAVVFGSFQSNLPGQSSNRYTYFYGVGLK